MPRIDDRAQRDADAVLRRVLEQRADRPSPSFHRRSDPATVGDGGPHAPARRARVALVACTVLVVAALVALAVQTGPAEDAGMAGEGAVPPSPYALDLTELPPPKYYGAMSSSPVGSGSLLVPGGAATHEDPAAVGPAAGYARQWYFDTSRSVDLHDRRERRWSTAMAWSIPAEGGPDQIRGYEAMFDAEVAVLSVQDEVDGIVFSVASNDPEVTDGQLRALLERMVAQYHRSRGSEPPPASDDPSVRLTPRPEQLPTLPPTVELEAAFASASELERDWYWSPFEPIGPIGWVLVDRDRHAFPAFDLDGKLIGVYVSGLGIVPRDEYEAPDFDPETASSDRF